MNDREQAFWEAVAKTDGTRMATVRFSDDTWHQLVITGAAVYFDGTVLPAGEFASWDRSLDEDEVARLFAAFAAD